MTFRTPYSALSALLLLASMSSAVGAAAARTDRPDPLARDAKLSLNTISDAALTGTFTDTATGDTVAFEVMVGEPTPIEALFDDPTAPPAAMDARFSDERGVFLLRCGADSPMDATWLGAAAEKADVSLMSRAASFLLARQAAHAVLEAVADESLAVKMQAAVLLEMAQAIPDGELLQGDGEILDTQLGRLEPPMRLLAVQYVHEIEIRRKSAFLDGLPANHSAVIVRSRNMATNQLVFYMATSNHGTWADSSTMSTKCRRSFPYRTNIAPPLMANNECDRYSSYGFTCGRHVCNDDTRKQYLNVKYNSSNTSSATCTDCTLNLFAPSCD